MERDLREQVLPHTAEFLHVGEYGDYYKVDADLRGPTGVTLHVRSPNPQRAIEARTTA